MATLEKRDLSGRLRRETIALDTDGDTAPAVTAVGSQSVRALRNIIDRLRDPVVQYCSWPGHGCDRLREYTDSCCLFGSLAWETQRAMEELVEFTELGDYLDLPKRTYSAGMMPRLAFSLTTTVRSDVLLLDEWIAAVTQALLRRPKRGRRILRGGQALSWLPRIQRT
jgi:hypothetical protein